MASIKEANDLLRQGKYAEAIAMYEKCDQDSNLLQVQYNIDYAKRNSSKDPQESSSSPKEILNIIVSSPKNLRYYENFALPHALSARLRLFFNTCDGLRPLHDKALIENASDEIVPLDPKQSICIDGDTMLLPEDYILTENDIAICLRDERTLDSSAMTPLQVLYPKAKQTVEGRATVIIPTYKRKENLNQAIESVCMQDYTDIEIIVVDDNGPDTIYSREVEKIVAQYKGLRQNCCITLIQHNRNRDGSAARNTGIFHASGEYISFLDDDDIYLPGRITKSIDVLEHTADEIGAVYCGFLGALNSYENDLHRYPEGDLTREILSLEFEKFYLHTNTATYKRSALMRLNGFDESFSRHQDLELNLRFFEHFRVAVLKEALVQIRPGKSENNNFPKNRVMLELKNKFLTRFQYLIEKQSEEDQKNIYHAHYTQLYKHLNAPQEALAQYRDEYKDFSVQQILLLVDKNNQYYVETGFNHVSKKQWWQAVSAFEMAIDSVKMETEAQKKYAIALTHMQAYQKAEQAWERANILTSQGANDWFAYGEVQDKLGLSKKAKQAFGMAVRYSNMPEAKEHGIGVFYEKRGDWVKATEAYLREKSRTEPHLCRIAYALERSYRWKEAKVFHDKILSTSTVVKGSHYYRLGFVEERMCRYREASLAYRMAIRLEKSPRVYLYYRLGYVLFQDGRYKAASKAFLKMTKKKPQFFSAKDLDTLSDISVKALLSEIHRDTTQKKAWYQLAQKYFALQQYAEAEMAFSHYMARVEDFDKTLFYILGEIQARQGKFKDAALTLSRQRILQHAYGINESVYKKSAVLQTIMHYSELYERNRLNGSIVVYESNQGQTISGDPYAIFKMHMKNKAFKKQTHVWGIADGVPIPDALKSLENVLFVRRDSHLFLHYLTEAQYLINNFAFPDYFIRKQGQKYLNTWHEISLVETKSHFHAPVEVTRDMLQATHLWLPYEKGMLYASLPICQILPATCLTQTTPMLHAALCSSADEKNEMRNMLGIPLDKKILLYLWDQDITSGNLNLAALNKDLEALSKIENLVVLYEDNKTYKALLDIASMTNIVAIPSQIDIVSLFPIVDMLLTDYDSRLLDYIPFGKPILHYLHKEKSETRFLDAYENRGEKVYERKEMLDRVRQYISKEVSLKTIQSEVPKPKKRSKKGTLDMIFNTQGVENTEKQKVRKKLLVFYGGNLKCNGITTSLIGLLNGIDKTRYHVVLLLDIVKLKGEVQWEQISKIDKQVMLVPRLGRMNMTLEEKWIRDKKNRYFSFSNEELDRLYRHSFEREYRRIMGSVRADALIHFEGYNKFWTSILASAAPKQAKKRFIYQHADMMSEKKLKYPWLEICFRQYRYFDAVISPSRESREVNRYTLSSLYGIDQSHFKYLHNVLQPHEILTLADAGLESVEDEAYFEEGFAFLNIARHSPEKDLQKLIHAFKAVVEKYPETKLINLGTGALEQALRQQIAELSLEDHVFLLGEKSNPYAYLKRADCFVFSSNHEGQPMVLFEALVLQKQIIATDIPGNRSVLGDQYGHLVENSSEGLARSMLSMLASQKESRVTFDYEGYNQEAIRNFYALVL